MKPKQLILTLLTTTTFFGVVPLTHPITSIDSGSAQAQTKFVTYTERNFFSIQHPSGWSIDKSASNYITIWSRRPSGSGGGTAPPDLIKTDITLAEGSLDTVVKREIESSQENNSTVKQRRNLTINGRNAVRVHLTGGGFAFPDTILSFIRYNNKQTVVITSYYTASNSRASATIERIHGSFRLLR
ncbi:MAG: hypothetical protein Fur006_30100 [Coleofasciculaceae cyanobacterium]